MINLLPNDIKRDISAARSNVILLRYNILTIVAASALVVICLLFYFILNSNKSNAATQTTENTAKSAQYDPTRKAAKEYQENLATAKSIFEKNVEYTPTILSIVELLPEGVILDGLSLKASDYGKPTSFSASAMTIEQATKLKEEFQESELFENVHFQNVDYDTSGQSAYPVKIVLSLTIKKAAP